ncbi:MULTISPECIES: type VI secretion system tube protein TssD [Citrobacter]|uniref:type VI secretion system tube protein TssD n=1 Tax=Citrobacter TaxID=544 RepID=UPI0011DD2BFC|nr:MULTISPECIES: type VI secretion system tube protein TssD [Citrobacter]MBD0806613.1 type VI secretion system tube protein Hcp [Citrobacter sp. C13]MBJ9847929.1 type VI secretion system tube protein Hcp [Citrobacter freundii]KAA0542091.1 type VI secretion system tube protein Hcp [Citrobacter portucalensis]MBI1681066.1 type VI secretion system tube protein Hcp [Citrobacter portucalensis]MDE9678049.1 type VI secretion system tube protein Hcp [Citrobacter portucalensis]
MSNIVYLKLIGEQQGDISCRCGTTDSVGNRWQRNHVNEIFVFSLCSGVTNSGKGANLQRLTFSKQIDKSSPLLVSAINNNENLFLEFWFYRINRYGQWERYYYIQLRGASISSIQMRVINDEIDTETISVDYDYILSKHLISNTEFSYLALPAEYNKLFVPASKPQTHTLNSAGVGRLLAAGGIYNGNIEGFRDTAEKLGGDAIKGYDQILNEKTVGVAITAASIVAGYGLGRMELSSTIRRLEKLRRIETKGVSLGRSNTTDNLYRRTSNTEVFSDLKVPMQMRYVEQAAREGGIGLGGVKVRIIRDSDLKGKNIYGYTHPNGDIDLYPDAFTDIEQLIKTLGHERTHTMQIYLFKHPNTYADDAIKMNKELILNEKAAHSIEDSFWQFYLNNKTGKLEEYK